MKKDRKDHMIEKLRTFEGRQQNWPAIKQLRRNFVPRFSKRGAEKSSIPSHFPNDCARFFANEHWKRLPQVWEAERPSLYPQCPEEGPFTQEEFNAAIDGLKANKAGGPDGLIMELFKDMDEGNRAQLLTLYNEIYTTETIPDHFNEALVVQIYKHGKHLNSTPATDP